MENEKLSGSFIQKYDPLSDSFVVVENNENKGRKFEPFSFFKKKSKIMESDQYIQPEPAVPQQPPQPTTNPLPDPSPSNNTQRPQPSSPPSSPKPQPMPPSNTPVLLARDAFNDLKILNSIYQTLGSTSQNSADFFDDLISENTILQATLLSIYQTLSGNNFVPHQNQSAPILTGNYCSNLLITQNYLQNIIDIIILLQRSVNVQNIDRQLTIINATLFSQKSKLATLQNTSCNTSNSQDLTAEEEFEEE